MLATPADAQFIRRVWTCGSQDCSKLTAAADDTLDAKLALSTAPAKAGTSAPATCVEGELYFDTDATDGENLLCCHTTNTWATCGDGAGGGTMTDVGDCNGPVCFTGTEGDTLTGATRDDVIDLGTDATFIYRRNDAGIVTFMGADNSSPASTTYDTTGAGAIVVGSADVTSISLDSVSTLLWPSGSGVTTGAATTLVDFSQSLTLGAGGGAFTYGQWGGTYSVANTIFPVAYMMEAAPTFDFNSFAAVGSVYTISPFYSNVTFTSDDGWILYQDAFHAKNRLVYAGAGNLTNTADNPWVPIDFLSNSDVVTTGAGDYSYEQFHNFRSRSHWQAQTAGSHIAVTQFASFAATGPETDLAGAEAGTLTFDSWAGLVVDWGLTADALGDNGATVTDFFGVQLNDIVSGGSGTITRKWSLWVDDDDIHMSHPGNVQIHAAEDSITPPTHALEVGGAQAAVTAGAAVITHGAAAFAYSGSTAYAWIKDDATVTVGSASSVLGTISSYWNNSAITTNSTTASALNLPTSLTFYDNSTISTSVANDPASVTSFASLTTWGSTVDRVVTNSILRGAHLTPAISAGGAGTDFQAADIRGLEVLPRLVSSAADGGDVSSVLVDAWTGVFVRDADGSGAGTETLSNYYGVYLERFDATLVTNAIEFTNEGGTWFPPVATTVGAGFTIDPQNKTIVRMTTTGASGTITSSIVTAVTDSIQDGQMLILYNGDATPDSIVIDDGGNTDLGGTDCTLSQGGTLTVIYDATRSLWVELRCEQ